MSFLDLAKKRCSTRAYQPVPVSQEHIDAIVEAARVAPTAANRQPVRILQVTSEEGSPAWRKPRTCSTRRSHSSCAPTARRRGSVRSTA